MRISFLFILALLLGFISCSKNNDAIIETEEELHSVKFKVSELKQNHESMGLRANSSSKSQTIESKNNNVKQLLFVLCNENHFPISYSQKEPTEDQINFNLKNGKYIIKVYATTFGKLESKLNYDGNSLALYLPNLFTSNEGKTFQSFNSGEIFIGGREIEVNRDSTYSPLELNRLSSRIDVNILDTAPPDFSYIEITTNLGHVLLGGLGSSPFEGVRYSSNTIVPNNQIKYSMFNDATTLAGKSNSLVKFDLLTTGQTYLNFSEKLVSVDIKTFNKNNELISKKTIPNVKLIPNTITKLTGNLFEDFNRNKGTNMNITYNNDFSEDILDYTF